MNIRIGGFELVLSIRGGWLLLEMQDKWCLCRDPSYGWSLEWRSKDGRTWEGWSPSDPARFKA